MSIKYYHLAKDEALPDEFCAVRDVGGEPSEYVFYVPEAENARLRELIRDLWLTGSLCDAIPDMRLQAKGGDWRTMQERVDEALGIEVDA